MTNTILSSLSPRYTDSSVQPLTSQSDISANLQAASSDETELRDTFGQFVGETFFGQMLSAMRKTVGKPAYFYGGQAEEMFRGQLDQLLAEKMSEASSDSFSDSMFDLFQLKRM